MLAQNPKTGKPIRILRSEASLWRSQKTIVWLDHQDTSIPWSRWDTGVVGLDALHSWQAAGIHIDYPILLDTAEETVKWFLDMDSTQHRMIFITRDLVFKIGEQTFRGLRRTNVICLEEIHRMYPFLGTAWTGEKEDAQLLVSALMRVKRIVGLGHQLISERLTFLQSSNVSFEFIEGRPRELWLITQFYTPDKARREREIKKCLEMNVACPFVDKIVLLNESDLSAQFPKKGASKLQQHIIGTRLTYKHVLEWIHRHAPKDTLCVFANADIYIDNTTWRDAWSCSLDNTFMALLRWDVQEDGTSKLFGPRNDSQDTWAVLSDSVKDKTWDWASLEIPFGKAGCDNAITVEMLRKKFLIVNPALSLKTHHLHLTNHRSYDILDVVDKPMYMYVDPTGIHDMEPVFDLEKNLVEKIHSAPFTRRLASAQPKALDTYCKMLERGERYLFKSNEQNAYGEQTTPLYRYKHVFQTPQGLVYAYDRLYIGKHESSKEAWSKSQLSSVSPAFYVKRSFAVPWHEDMSKTQEGYVLDYVSKVLLLRERYGEGDFWAPPKGMVSALELFQWGTPEVPVVPHSDSAQIWSEEVIQYPWMDKQELHKEEIDVLRKYLKDSWKAESTKDKRWVVMVDGTKITMEMVRAWEETYTDLNWTVVFEGRTSADRIVEKLSGASGFIAYGGPNSVSRWGFSWALPLGAPMVEVQNEMDPNGEAAHVSGAAGLTHLLVVVPRASEKATHDLITKHVYQALEYIKAPAHATVATQGSDLPVIHMPRSSLTGFFAHAGDSFREMVTCWAEKGYVHVVDDTKAVQVWLGGIGQTLLYDRPTMDWLFAAPAEEQTWKKALFGNPKPSESGGPSSSWFFWPRRPALVEEMAPKISVKGWNERTKQLVFYGKIENKVQEKRRLNHDWQLVCDEYIMVKGESDPYALTQEQYLERLSNARFGLCLAGYGKKCHREVECMAMGCVPVVASDVDMENYANPPKEGIHYIRVSSPQDGNEKLARIRPEAWAVLSEACRAWWKENASAEGSWNLTKKLRGLAP